MDTSRSPRQRSVRALARRTAAPGRSTTPANAALGADPRIDAYIAKSASFAQPILTYLRSIIHATCPEVHETIKWGRPFFEYHGLLCMMAAFKQHCHYALWRSLVERSAETEQLRRITTVSDLPVRRELVRSLRQAMAANCERADPATRKPVPKRRPPAPIPDDLRLALKAQPQSGRIFAAFSASAQREYCEWLSEAKRPATRASRLAQALTWIAQGKTRHWKYRPA